MHLVGPNGLVRVVSREPHQGQGIADIRNSTVFESSLQQIDDAPSGTAIPCSASEAFPPSVIRSVLQGGHEQSQLLLAQHRPTVLISF